ncbi:MAG: EF-hand domain-containing protein [Proteobacteria bacterium]|nr:EF-hand domain-containing protein [Pseudomonadota bacterium]MBU1581973.1 EF-hand domain-containing protein [Pseudomonadota bacterium]MBU2455882.1 EF-hand domain-containing protein [Pseudomonadota bacterium]MBU2627424.1 EF-hand domain-containing protein [Pseudomonadota bacterium]
MNIQGIGQSFTAYRPSGMQNMRGSFDPSSIDVNKIMEKKDTNVDGVLSADETSMSENMFSTADADSDGLLSLEEFEDMLSNGPPPPPPPQQMGGMGQMGGMKPMGGMDNGAMDIDAVFEEEDTNEDGVISAEESSLSDNMFSRIDTNQDGQLSAEEVEQSLAQRKENMNTMQGFSSRQTLTQSLAITAYQEAIQSFITNFSNDVSGASMSTFLGTIA